MKIKKIVKKFVPQKIWNRLRYLKKVIYRKQMYRKNKKIKDFQKDKYPYGVNLMGDIQAETGLGQSMRMVAKLLENAGVPFGIKQMDVPGNMEHRERQWDGKMDAANRYGINILHINNSIWEENYNKIPVKDLDGRYNIAYWLWELEEFPEEWVYCIDTVDEIWTPAEFVSKGIRKKTDKPVMTMPYGMEIDMRHLLKRQYFGLPEDKFLFLVMYDFLSVSERKNPHGVVEAYKRAFHKENMEVGLVIKINHVEDRNEIENLKKEMEDYHGVYFITKNMSRNEVESLIASVDVLVSLHRAEGFGLPLAEAMYLGTAVIATNWSAPVEFMDENSACLVDYKMMTLKEDIGPYQKGNRWADADIIQAAEYMKKLSCDKKYYMDKVLQGKVYIREKLSVEKMAARMAERLKEISEK